MKRFKVGSKFQNQSYKIDFRLMLPCKSYVFSSAVADKKERGVKAKFFDEIKSFITNSPIENLSLFNKHIPIIVEATFKKPKKTEILFSLEKESIGGEAKFWILEGLLEKFTVDKFELQLEFLKKRVKESKKNLEKQGYILIFNKSLQTSSRLIVGLGSAHPLETSITLHHIFGIPYIPASALKGVCRMVAFWKIAQSKKIIEDEAKLEKLQKKFYGELAKDDFEVLKYQLLFGAQNFKGLLLFLDAYPEIPSAGKIFELDVMNVHYREYYSGNEPPADWHNPNPIFFLTVRKGVPFNFWIFFDKYRFKKLEKENAKLLSVLKDWNYSEEVEDLLHNALKEFGVGAKTSLGYGFFE